MGISNAALDSLFEYHAPNEDQIADMKLLRTDAKILARTINKVVPESADKSAAIRLLRQCVQISNAGIVLNGVV